jgi:hypothetical protein
MFDQTNDPYTTIDKSQPLAYIVPAAPLIAGHQYKANITGTSNGVAFTKSFTYTVSGPAV